MDRKNNGALDSEFAAGTELPKPKVLFQRIDDEQIEQEIEKLHNLSKI